MDLYKNAIDSIILGIEDYNSADPRRLISATRNLVAGILLLIKQKLVLLSPPDSDEVLIKQRISPKVKPDGSLEWSGSGKKTVDVQQMQERCDSLSIFLDWKRVQRIVNHRNEIEHYFPSLTQSALRTLISDSFILIRDLLRVQLEKDPLVELGSDTWTILTKTADVYDQEKRNVFQISILLIGSFRRSKMLCTSGFVQNAVQVSLM